MKSLGTIAMALILAATAGTQTFSMHLGTGQDGVEHKSLFDSREAPQGESTSSPKPVSRGDSPSTPIGSPALWWSIPLVAIGLGGAWAFRQRKSL